MLQYKFVLIWVWLPFEFLAQTVDIDTDQLRSALVHESIQSPALKGIRRVLHTQADELSQSETFRANVATLAKHDLSFDLCVTQKQLGIARELALACPEVRFILEHCGVPEVLMKIYNSAVAGDWEAAKQAQFKLLDLFSLMVNAPNFPEGFRAGYQVRGFETGNARFPLSPEEQKLMKDIRSPIACVLAECGFTEAATMCNPAANGDFSRVDIEAIVHDVMKGL